MSHRTAVEKWADQEGFRPAVPFAGRASKLGGRKGARYSGFYLLLFKDDTFYLGESVDLRSRMSGHNTVWGSEIADVRFLRRSLSKQGLRAVEKGLIKQLVAAAPGRCRNITHAGAVPHRDDLADLLDADEQAEWLADRPGFNATDPSPLKPIPADQAVKYRTAARRLLEHPDRTGVIDMLRAYLEKCVPAPRRTEYHGWNVSTGTYGGARLLCVSVGRMESFVVFSGGGGFINLAPKDIGLRERLRIRGLHKDVRAPRTRQYHDFGDVLLVRADSAAGIRALLNDPVVIRAASDLTYAVMRKHPSVYTRYHCPQVVEAVYPERVRVPDVEDAPNVVLPAEPVEVVEAVSANRPGAVDGTAEESVGAPVADDALTDEYEIDWLVNAGPINSKADQPDDFLARSEWRMAPNAKYEHLVQQMYVGERIAVRRRRNVRTDVPFDTRGHLVSAMDILLTGVITENPGDGVSVGVLWDPPVPNRRWYLYTSQDTVWKIPRGLAAHYDELSAFVFEGADQDVDAWRNLGFWSERFGDR